MRKKEKLTVHGFSLFSFRRYSANRLYLFHSIANRSFCNRISDDWLSLDATAKESNLIQSKNGYIRTCEKYLQYFITQVEFRIGNAQREKSNKRTIYFGFDDLEKLFCVVIVKYLLIYTFTNQCDSIKITNIFGDPVVVRIQIVWIACLACFWNQISSTTCTLRWMKITFYICKGCENIRTWITITGVLCLTDSYTLRIEDGPPSRRIWTIGIVWTIFRREKSIDTAKGDNRLLCPCLLNFRAACSISARSGKVRSARIECLSFPQSLSSGPQPSSSKMKWVWLGSIGQEVRDSFLTGRRFR